MKKRLRSFLASTWLTAALLFALGLLFLIFPEKIDGAMYLLLFSALLILGGGQLLMSLRSDRGTDAGNKELGVALVVFLAAFFLYFRWSEVSNLSQYLFSFLIVLSATRKLQSAITLHTLGTGLWYLLLLTGLVNFAYGALLLFWRFTEENGVLLYRLLGSGFLFSAVTDLLSSLWVSFRVKAKALEQKEEAKNAAG